MTRLTFLGFHKFLLTFVHNFIFQKWCFFGRFRCLHLFQLLPAILKSINLISKWAKVCRNHLLKKILVKICFGPSGLLQNLGGNWSCHWPNPLPKSIKWRFLLSRNLLSVITHLNPLEQWNNCGRVEYISF